MKKSVQNDRASAAETGRANALVAQLLVDGGFTPETQDLARYAIGGLIGSVEQMLANRQEEFRYWSVEWFLEDFPERYRLGWEFREGRYRVLLTETMSHEKDDRWVDPYPLAEASLPLQLLAAPYLDKLVDELREHFDSPSCAVGREEVPSWTK